MLNSINLKGVEVMGNWAIKIDTLEKAGLLPSDGDAVEPEDVQIKRFRQYNDLSPSIDLNSVEQFPAIENEEINIETYIQKLDHKVGVFSQKKNYKIRKISENLFIVYKMKGFF